MTLRFFFKYCTVGIYQKQAIMPVFIKYIPCIYRYFLLKPPPY